MPTPRSMPSAAHSFALATGLLVCLAYVMGPAAAPLAAQQGPDPFLQGFVQIGTYVVMVDGKKDPGAKIYQSERARAFLLVGSKLEQPLVIDLRSRQVETVGIMSLAKRADGSIDILGDAAIKPQGPFEVGDSGVSFKAEGHEYQLAERESLVGPHKASELTAYDPSYARGVAAYRPNPTLVSELDKESKAVRVQVFFNSKCSHCRLMVPRIIKLQETLDNPKISFDYYGVPDSFKDPVMREKSVTGTPTGIVYIGGKEVGRIVGDQWKIPELALKNVLLSAGAAS